MSDQLKKTKAEGCKRRDFLKAGIGVLGATAVAAGGSTKFALAQENSTPQSSQGNDFDVVVIGGGFAGVAAARELRHAGLSVLLLEARNRLGGRTFTVEQGGKQYELGGAFVHSTQPSVFAEVIRYGLELEDASQGVPDKMLWWDGKSTRDAGMRGFLPLAKMAACASDSSADEDISLTTAQGFAIAAEQLEQFHEGAASAFPQPYTPFNSGTWREADKLSVHDRLNQMDLSPSLSPILEGMLGSLIHGDFKQVSYAEMLRVWSLCGNDTFRYLDSISRYKFKHGTRGLIDAMIDDGRPEVRLGTAVSEIHDKGNFVEVVTSSGQKYKCRSTVVAVPMNVLANIKFYPGLSPLKLAASRQQHAGKGLKFYIRLRQNVGTVALFAGEGEPINSIYNAAGDEANEGSTLVAFSSDASKIDPRNKSQVQDVLRRFLPDVDVLDTLTYDWHLDPYSLGTWCVLKKGMMTEYLQDLQEPQGSIHFAGGDIASAWRGFIDGAIASGSQVAHRVAQELGARSQAVNSEKSSELASAAPLEKDALQQCTVCHTTDASGAPGVGPNLRGKFDLPAGSDPKFNYSEALSNRDVTWTAAELDKFLKNPSAFAPGTTMGFGGVQNPAERAAIIEALRNLK
jgi:monoamine oxidase